MPNFWADMVVLDSSIKSQIGAGTGVKKTYFLYERLALFEERNVVDERF